MNKLILLVPSLCSALLIYAGGSYIFLDWDWIRTVGTETRAISVSLFALSHVPVTLLIGLHEDLIQTLMGE